MTSANNKVKKKLRMKQKPFYILWVSFLILFLILFGYSIYHVVLWYFDNQKINDTIEEILQTVTINEVIDTQIDSTMVNEPVKETDIYWKYKDVSFIDVDINHLKEENSDTVAWIQVLGTNINYPVVQAKDNDYYLNHDFKKRVNGGGWVFLDYRNDINSLGGNTIIYGHRRYNESIFGSLKNVLTDSWLQNTDYHIIKISTAKYNYLFQVFSVYSIPNESYFIRTQFSNEDEFQEFLTTIQNRSIYDFQTEVNLQTSILTLATCHNDNDRLVVHSKLIKISEKD